MTLPRAHTDAEAARVRLVALDVPDAGPLHVLVLAADPLARAGLASFFADTDAYAVVGSTALDDDLEAALDAFRPDVALWDLGPADAAPPDLEPLHAAAVPVVALVPDEARVEAARAAEAQGVLLRTAPRRLILSALVAAHDGLVVLDPDLADAVLPAAPGLPDAADLTPREHEVLALLGEGLPNKLIADRLGISEHTAKFHVAAVMGKLGARSRTEAVVLAARQGLVRIVDF